MLRLFDWIKRYWWLCGIGLLVLLGILAGRHGPRVGLPSPERIFDAFAALHEGRKAREAELEKGKEEAITQVRSRFRAKLFQLSRKERERAEQLSKDPEKLARFLAFAGTSEAELE